MISHLNLAGRNLECNDEQSGLQRARVTKTRLLEKGDCTLEKMENRLLQITMSLLQQPYDRASEMLKSKILQAISRKLDTLEAMLDRFFVN